jgi:hypothetical protein
MFSIRDYPIHDVNERCILPTKKRLTHNIKNNYQDIYGNDSHYRERFNDLGLPIFIVKMHHHDEPDDEEIHHGQDGVISDELFDQLFERVEVKPKPKKPKTLKKRKKSKK